MHVAVPSRCIFAVFEADRGDAAGRDVAIPRATERAERAKIDGQVAKIGSVRFGVWRTFSDFQTFAGTLRTVDDRVRRPSGLGFAPAFKTIMPVFQRRKKYRKTAIVGCLADISRTVRGAAAGASRIFCGSRRRRVPGPVKIPTSPRRRDSSPRNTRVAAAASPRLVSTEYPRRSRGGAATRLRGLSTSPAAARRRDSSPRNIHIAAAAASPTEYPPRGRGASPRLASAGPRSLGRPRIREREAVMEVRPAAAALLPEPRPRLSDRKSVLARTLPP